MSDDYLWDKSGPPDPEIARLERALAPLRYRPKPRRKARPRIAYVALAAGVLLAAGAGGWLATRDGRASLAVTRVEGAPTVASNAVMGTAKLRVGEWLTTGSDARARIDLGAIGDVDVLHDSRIRLVTTSATEKRLELAHGTIEAHVTAPPRLFVVKTAAAAAVDLGCAYTLTIDDAGFGELRVSSGWVALEGEHTVYVPARAIAPMRGEAGPGTPFFEDAPAQLVDALAGVDAGRQDPATIAAIVDAARAKDSLSLWHLLTRTGGDARHALYARLSELASPPAGLTESGTADEEKMMLWRQELQTKW